MAADDYNPVSPSSLFSPPSVFTVFRPQMSALKRVRPRSAHLRQSFKLPVRDASAAAGGVGGGGRRWACVLFEDESRRQTRM